MGNGWPNPAEPILKTLDYGHDIALNVIHTGENITTDVITTGDKIATNAEIIVSDGVTDTLSTVQVAILLTSVVVLYSVMKIDIDKATDVVIVPFKTVGEIAKKIP